MIVSPYQLCLVRGHSRRRPCVLAGLLARTPEKRGFWPFCGSGKWAKSIRPVSFLQPKLQVPIPLSAR